ncbi:MAG: DUF3857 domain-containing protein [Chitinophagaceae bacterium]|nr:DUF3857 domain-containing protein [Chitinophagaceae bacterium]
MKVGFHKFFWLSIFILGASSVFGQQIGAVGAFTQAEWDMKACSFDPEAAAVYLDYEAVTDYDAEYRMITKYHVRLKILKDKAISAGDVIIPFYHREDFESITDIEGVSISPDPSGNPQLNHIDKKSIYTKQENEFYSTIRLAFPAVKAGTIIDYKFISTKKNYGGLENWVFQHEYPIIRSKYYLVILSNFEFSYSVMKQAQYRVDVKNYPEKGAISFEMRNLPGFLDEAYMDARKDYLHRVNFQLSRDRNGKKYMQDWDHVAQEFWADRDFGKQLDEKIPDARSFIMGLQKDPSQVSRMISIYHHLQKNFTWNGIESRYSIEGVRKTWEKKTGSSGDLNLLLLNLLQQAGIEAEPLLVSRRRHGKVYKEIPFADQFSTVFAYVILDGKNYILDASNELGDPLLYPVSVLNTTGLVVRKKTGLLFDIKPQTLYSTMSSISLKFSGDQFEGEGYLACMGYAKYVRLSDWKSSPAEYQKEFTKGIDEISLYDFKVTNDEADTLALEHRFKFKLPATQTGDYLFVPMDLFSGLDAANPFISTNRFSDINFGFNQRFLLNLIIDIPEGYRLEGLPAPARITDPSKSIVLYREAAMQETTGKIMMRFELQFNRSSFFSNEYDMVKELYKRIYNLLDEKIAFKKK